MILDLQDVMMAPIYSNGIISIVCDGCVQMSLFPMYSNGIFFTGCDGCVQVGSSHVL